MTDYPAKFRLTGRRAALFGASGLLGREIASALAQAGAAVLALDIDREGGAALAERCRAEGLDVTFLPFDLTRLDSLSSEIDRLHQRSGPFHVMVNAAYPRTSDWGAPLEAVEIASWRANLDMQLTSACIAARDFARWMKRGGIPGSIVNLGSIYGLLAPDFHIYEGLEMTMPAAYAAIKGGIATFSRYLAAYYGAAGIRVNAICPGGIENGQPEAFIHNYARRTPLGRLGRAEEVASATLFLASDAASYVTGTLFMVDGGWSAW